MKKKFRLPNKKPSDHLKRNLSGLVLKGPQRALAVPLFLPTLTVSSILIHLRLFPLRKTQRNREHNTHQTSAPPPLYSRTDWLVLQLYIKSPQYWSPASPQDWQHVVGSPIYMWKGRSVAPDALCVFLSEGSGIILFYLPAFWKLLSEELGQIYAHPSPSWSLLKPAQYVGLTEELLPNMVSAEACPNM